MCSHGHTIRCHSNLIWSCQNYRTSQGLKYSWKINPHTPTQKYYEYPPTPLIKWDSKPRRWDTCPVLYQMSWPESDRMVVGMAQLFGTVSVHQHMNMVSIMSPTWVRFFLSPLRGCATWHFSLPTVILFLLWYHYRIWQTSDWSSPMCPSSRQTVSFEVRTQQSIAQMLRNFPVDLDRGENFPDLSPLFLLPQWWSVKIYSFHLWKKNHKNFILASSDLGELLIGRTIKFKIYFC